MDRPRLLLVPQLTELEWLIKPQLEEWADVASFDAPGVGPEPGADTFTSEAVAARGLEELERRGWDRCVVVADEFGVAAAACLVETSPDVVEAMALGHARVSNELDGERAPLNREVHAGLGTLMKADTRTFIRQLFRLTGGETMEGGYRENMVDEYLARVPVGHLIPFWESRPDEGKQIGTQLSRLDVPLLLAQHKGCLLFTDEGFEQAVETLPHTDVARLGDKPSTSPEFAGVLEAFCRERVAVST